jgi:putative mRNA 3-end processing factor
MPGGGQREQGKASVLFCYAFGKAQRILHGLDASIGPILVHGAVEPLNRVYRDAGVHLPETLCRRYTATTTAAPGAGPGAPVGQRQQLDAPFRRLQRCLRQRLDAAARRRRRRGVDRGFVLSDHADWPGLLWAMARPAPNG